MARPGKGHRTPGSGKPKGYKAPQTLDKLAAREFVRATITARLGPMIEAQLAHAEGLKYLVVRDKRTGKFLRVTEAMARLKQDTLAENEETIEVWEKDPSVQAFSDLLNRALDKPAEQVKVTGDDGGPVEHVFRWRP